MSSREYTIPKSKHKLPKKAKFVPSDISIIRVQHWQLPSLDTYGFVWPDWFLAWAAEGRDFCNKMKSLFYFIDSWNFKWWLPKCLIKNFCFMNWLFFGVFGAYFNEFVSTFQSISGIFSPNVKSKVYFKCNLVYILM